MSSDFIELLNSDSVYLGEMKVLIKLDNSSNWSNTVIVPKSNMDMKYLNGHKLSKWTDFDEMSL